MSDFVTRFAPSPTGYLHLGHAASALLAYESAMECGGRFILRIEDIDITRCRPEYEAAIYEDLAWLGLSWEQPVRRQSDHFADYHRVVDALQARGLIYRCFKTRKEVLDDMARAPHGRGEVYFGAPLPKTQEQALLQSGAPYAWRLSMAACRKALGPRFDALKFSESGQIVTAAPDLLGDVVLGRKDVGTSYHLACCYDDALQGVTQIIRGEDLLEATHLHRLLQALMDWPVPEYTHHGLLTDSDGKRFAKRDKSLTLRALRAAGLSAETVRQRARLPKQGP